MMLVEKTSLTTWVAIFCLLLDSEHGEEVMKILCQLNEEGSTIVMVTHSEHDANYADRIVRLLDGKILSEKSPEKHYA